MSLPITHFNGTSAGVDDLAPLAFAGFAHFTAMQVRAGSVRGLDLHLARLRTASDELFGHHLPDARVRGYLRAALAASPADVSLTCFITAPPGEFMPTDGRDELDVLVKVTAASDPPAGPLRLDVVEHERHLAHIKHVGEVAKTQYLRRARDRGFDDAAFIDRRGRIGEATIWNLAFWDGASVLWPDTDVLPGVTMQILTRRLHANGIPQRTLPIHPRDLSDRISAVVMNSWTPGVPVTRIGERDLAEDADFAYLLHETYETEILTSV